MKKKFSGFIKGEICAAVVLILLGLCLTFIPVQTVGVICKIVFGVMMMAAGCYQAAAAMGLKIPEDVSIIGCNDNPAAKYMDPPLSTVRLHTDFMGQQAVALLADHIFTNRKIPMMITLPSELILRESVAPPKERG